MKPIEALKNYWGYETFLPKQQSVIASVLNAKDTLAILPTGAGKSLCYQVPALVQKGICVVISPLLALMQDQVEALKKRGVRCAYIKSEMRNFEVHQLLDNCEFGNYKLLYLSPERLKRQDILEHLINLPISFVAIDEAHCISQWGHDFRPAYREISKLRELRPDLRFLALTATATSAVRKDIIENLNLEIPDIYSNSFKKEQIALQKQNSTDKFSALLNFIQNEKGSGIIYVRKRQSTHDIVQFLTYHQISAKAFHAGIPTHLKPKILKQWLDNKIKVVVATTAFGMGIDKPDVRFVVHFHLPDSLENYYQEIGRAGRDKSSAKALLLYNSSDINHLKNVHLKSILTLKEVKFTYKKLAQHLRVAIGEGEHTTHDLSLVNFAKKYNIVLSKAYQSLKMLDQLGIIRLNQNYKQSTQLRFKAESKRVLHFIEQRGDYYQVVNTILRTYGGIFDHQLSINLELISDKSKIKVDQIILILKDLEEQGMIDLDIFKHDLTCTFLLPREDDISINPYKKIIQGIGQRKTAQVKAVLDFIENKNDCLQQELVGYFGENLPQSCKKCTNCLKQCLTTSNDLKQVVLDEISKHKSCSSQHLVQYIKADETLILDVIRQLYITKQIKLTPQKNYQLNA